MKYIVDTFKNLTYFIIKNTNYLTILFVCLFVLQSCETEQLIFDDEAQTVVSAVPDYEVEFFTSEQLTELSGILSHRTRKSNINWSSKSDGEGAVLDESRIITVKDSIGNTTYSLRLYVPNSAYNVFHNVLVKKQADGTYREPIVLRYEVDEEYYPAYKIGPRNQAPFKGRIDTYTMDAFGGPGLGLGKIGHGGPCGSGFDVDDNGGGSEGTTGTSGTSGQNGNSGTWTGGGSGSGGGSSSTDNDETTTLVEIGIGEFGDFDTDGDWKAKGTTSKNDPCDINLLVPVNEDGLDLKDILNNPCIMEIVTKLQQKDNSRLVTPNVGGLSGTSHLSQSILDLFDSSTSHNLIIKVEEAGTVNGNPKNAVTKKTVGKLEWTIVIDDEYARNATQLSIARTIIHESVHAFLGYTLNVNQNSNLSNIMKTYYNSLDSQQSLGSGVIINLTEHEFLGQYVQGIAKSLSIWDNGKQPQSYYENLAWGGLETSSAYGALNSTLKNTIRAIVINEQTANNSAKGKKCP